MNGYDIMGDACRKLLYGTRELPEDEKVELEAKIKAYDFLKEADERVLCATFESTAFNDMMKGYVCAVMAEYNLSHEIQADILEKFQDSLEKLRPKDALAEWDRHKSRWLS
ncbi:MAG: hypothetical protein IKS84_06075 [Lachnospiraceae bacterium]|nr:hypothetical protein [Lachnospiraceae bacterium]